MTDIDTTNEFDTLVSRAGFDNEALRRAFKNLDMRLAQVEGSAHGHCAFCGKSSNDCHGCAESEQALEELRNGIIESPARSADRTVQAAWARDLVTAARDREQVRVTVHVDDLAALATALESPAPKEPAREGAEVTVPDLLPCPCCGSRAYLITDMDGDGYIECSNKDTCSLETNYFASKEDALTAWNRREPIPAPVPREAPEMALLEVLRQIGDRAGIVHEESMGEDQRDALEAIVEMVRVALSAHPASPSTKGDGNG